MRSDSVKNMSAYADQNHAPSLTDVRLEFISIYSGGIILLQFSHDIFLFPYSGKEKVWINYYKVLFYQS